MRPLIGLDRAFGAVIVASNAVGSIWIFVMMAMVVVDVSGRYLFNAPVNGTTELVTMSVVAVLYMQIAYTLRSGRMTRSDAFLSVLTACRPALGNMFGLVFHLAGACLMAAIMWGAWPKWLGAYNSNFYVGVSGVFTFPEWPMLLIIFFGCALTGIQFLLHGVDNVLALLGRPPLAPRHAHETSPDGI